MLYITKREKSILRARLSEWGLFKVYTLESRIAFAGWTQANIDNYKGPSPEVVAGLAENVRLKLGSTYTVCEVSGYLASLVLSSYAMDEGISSTDWKSAEMGIRKLANDPSPPTERYCGSDRRDDS
jgi:hypothetical protein